MGRAFRLEHHATSDLTTVFIDHFTYERIVRAMDRHDMVHDFPYPDRPAPTEEQERREFLAAAVAEPAGIPRHKLTIDGEWLITPRELTAALGSYFAHTIEQRNAADQAIDQWKPWIGLLLAGHNYLGVRCL
ncbi:hypothetical protein [Kitasatospora cineracea]|uniref:hypothetical protein n=1 Tax=Kitasatospora cineracea TaxID=88074 RepID=UPI0036B47D07